MNSSLVTQLFREVRPDFFRVLAGPLARLYVDALDALEREASQRNQGIDRTGVGTNQQARPFAEGAGGQEQVIEASTNLLDWTPLTTNVLTTNGFQFIKTNTFRYSQRFYRSRIGP